MKARTLISSAALSLGMLALAAPGIANASWLSGHMVTQQGLQSVHAGQSLSDVVKALGKPESITKWADGSRSAVYDTTDTDVGRERVYVDLDAQDKVSAVEVVAP